MFNPSNFKHGFKHGFNWTLYFHGAQVVSPPKIPASKGAAATAPKKPRIGRSFTGLKGLRPAWPTGENQAFQKKNISNWRYPLVNTNIAKADIFPHFLI